VITKVIMPKLGLVMKEGLVVCWHAVEGDRVEASELLLEIESDKVTTEIGAPASGVLRKIIVREEEIVPCGTVVGVVAESADEEIPGLEGIVAEARAVVLTREQWERKQTLPEAPEQTGSRRAEAKVRISPAAKKLAKSHGIDLSQLRGTGPGGRIVREDVMRAVEASAEQPETRPEEGRPGEIAPLSRMRRSIADNMARSARSVARVVHFAEVDMSRAVDYRNDNRESFAKEAGADLSYNALLIKATAAAMAEDPVLNVSLEEDGIRQHGEINVGLAVALDEGLLTVSIKQADGKGLRQIAKESAALIEKARSGRLQVDDVTGNSITISSLGGFEIESFTPIVNLPEVAILGVGSVVERPVVKAGKIEIAPIVKLSLSFDHRVVDGAPAARFLQLLKRKLETLGFLD
jgi:pyruvate dehydrogenase E2 component (dihydrolipoamide acetyltransferase)